MRSQGFGTRGSIGNIEPVGTVKTYGPAALESVQGMNLMSNMPDGWLRPNFQVLSKAQHIDLANSIAAVDTYHATVVSSVSGTIAEGFWQQDGLIFIGTGVGLHRSNDAGLTFGSVLANTGRCNMVRRIRPNEWISNKIDNVNVVNYYCSSNNGDTWAMVQAGTTAGGGVVIPIIAADYDGARYVAFRGDSKYYISNTGIGAINSETTGPWSILYDIHFISGQWVAAMKKGSETGVFTSSDLVTWTKRLTVADAAFATAETTIQSVGAWLFACEKLGRKTYRSNDGGVTWAPSASIQGGAIGICTNGMAGEAPGWIAYDGSVLMSSACVSFDGGFNWVRWIQNPAATVYVGCNAIYSTGAGAFFAYVSNPSAPTIVSRTRLFDPATHFQIPGSASFSSIPFPIMRVR